LSPHLTIVRAPGPEQPTTGRAVVALAVTMFAWGLFSGFLLGGLAASGARAAQACQDGGPRP